MLIGTTGGKESVRGESNDGFGWQALPLDRCYFVCTSAVQVAVLP